MQKTKPDIEAAVTDCVDSSSDTLDTGAMLVELARAWRDSKPSPEQCIWPIEGLLFS